MSEGNMERTIVLFLGVVMVAGLAFDYSSDEVQRPERLPIEGALLYEQASFCPAALNPAKGSAQITVVAPDEGETRFAVAPGAGSGLQRIEGPAAKSYPIEIYTTATGYEKPVVASSTLQVEDPIDGAGAARCSRVASTRWYFPEGSSELGFDERLMLYNPFPDEAVARVTFSTPGGDISKARLAEGIPVPAGEVRVVKVNEFVPPEKVLGAIVEMSRGRVVAWRASILDPKKRPGGLQFTLGARAPATTWYLPAGSVEAGIDERLTLMNPSREEAMVTISLVTAKETLQPPKLVEVPIPPGTTKRLTLAENIGRGQDDVGGSAVIVRSINEVGVVAERSLFYDLEAVTGVSSEIGAAVARTTWMVAPALLRPAADTVLLLNPGPQPARVDITVLDGSGRQRRPGYLQDVRIAPSTRRRIELKELGAVLLVTSDNPIVSERSATTARDAAAVLGIPVGD